MHRTNRNRFLIIFSLLLSGTVAISAFDVLESASATGDYPGGQNFATNPLAGTLDEGSNTVSGSLAGSCVVGTFIDCNPGLAETGDTQDSFLIAVPTGFQITNLAVTTSSVTGPANFSASLAVNSPTASVLFVPFLSPLNGTTANLITTPIGAGTYAVSVYGQQANAAGAFSLNWSLAMTLATVDVTPEDALNNLIDLISNPNSGLGLTNAQIRSLTRKLNDALASVQTGQNANAIDQLDSFIKSVRTLLKSRKITAQTANTLIAAAEAIIASLQ